MQDRSSSYRLIIADHTLAEPSRKLWSQVLEGYLEANDLSVGSVGAGLTLQENSSKSIPVLVSFLLMMALLTAFVGSIGLTGTMGMNVLERTREIGVMRAIGAVDFEIIKSVVIEGVLIGLITWVLAIGLSFPISTLAAAHHQRFDDGLGDDDDLHPVGDFHLAGRGDRPVVLRQHPAGAQCRPPDDQRGAGVRVGIDASDLAEIERILDELQGRIRRFRQNSG